jgi:hypothetical protein
MTEYSSSLVTMYVSKKETDSVKFLETRKNKQFSFADFDQIS